VPTVMSGTECPSKERPTRTLSTSQRRSTSSCQTNPIGAPCRAVCAVICIGDWATLRSRLIPSVRRHVTTHTHSVRSWSPAESVLFVAH
jgi:hypothetical protein